MPCSRCADVPSAQCENQQEDLRQNAADPPMAARFNSMLFHLRRLCFVRLLIGVRLRSLRRLCEVVAKSPIKKGEEAEFC